MNARLYDAKLHRFLVPDNFVQDPYNTQNYNRYSYVLNNPLSFVDPSGEELTLLGALVIGIVIGVTTNGIVNSIHHQPFFKGAIQAGLIGAFSGAMAFGIGGTVTSMTGSSLGKFAFQTIAHGFLGAWATGASGGSMWHGFVAGAVGSMIAFGTGKLLGNVKKAYLQAGGMIFAGGVGGGVASVVGGGKFWDGFRNGLISAGLNHATHYVYNSLKNVEDYIKRYEKNNKIIIENSQKIEILNYLTKFGQLKGLTNIVVDKWIEATNESYDSKTN